MKVVINACFGGFSLSPEAALRLYELGMTDLATPVGECFSLGRDRKKALDEWREYKAVKKDRSLFLTVFTPDEKFVISTRPDTRIDPRLIQVVEEMGTAADGDYAELKIVEIPDDVDFEISEYDGMEHIAEKHRTWP